MVGRTWEELLRWRELVGCAGAAAGGGGGGGGWGGCGESGGGTDFTVLSLIFNVKRFRKIEYVLSRCGSIAFKLYWLVNE